MTKKIRLIDEEPVEETKSAPSAGNLDTEKLMKFLEAMDWKLWEMLKLMRAQSDKDEDK